VEKSVAVYEEQGAGARYRLLETLRQYARERLEEAGEAAAIGRQHAQFFLALAEEAEPRLRTADRRVWLDQLQREYDNLRAALAWSHGDPEAREIELRLAGALWRFWFLQGNFSEGHQWLEEAVAGIGAEAREEEVGFTRARAKVLYGVGMLGSAWVHP